MGVAPEPLGITGVELVGHEYGHHWLLWVTFDKNDGKGKQDLLHRFLQHVLPPGFVKIRHYGLMAPSNATTKLEVARRLLEAEHPDLPGVVGAFAAVLLLAKAAKHLTAPVAPADDWRAHFERLTGIDVSRCPRCHIGRLTPHPLPSLWAKKPPDDTS